MKLSRLIEVLRRVKDEEGDSEVLIHNKRIAFIEVEYFSEEKKVFIG